MRLSHLLIAGATAVSFSAFAGGDKKDQPQAQSEQSQQSQSGSRQQASQGQETVKQAQEKLSAAGHQVQVDGILGAQTQAALKEFQQAKGLDASGQLDQQTLAALGVAEGGGASTGSTSTEKSSDASPAASGGSSTGAEPKSESKEKSKY